MAPSDSGLGDFVSATTALATSALVADMPDCEIDGLTCFTAALTAHVSDIDAAREGLLQDLPDGAHLETAENVQGVPLPRNGWADRLRVYDEERVLAYSQGHILPAILSLHADSDEARDVEITHLNSCLSDLKGWRMDTGSVLRAACDAFADSGLGYVSHVVLTDSPNCAVHPCAHAVDALAALINATARRASPEDLVLHIHCAAPSGTAHDALKIAGLVEPLTAALAAAHGKSRPVVRHIQCNGYVFLIAALEHPEITTFSEVRIDGARLGDDVLTEETGA